MWVDRAGERDAGVLGRRIGRVGWYEAYPAMKSSEISASAPARRAATAWPSSWISVKTASAPASHRPNSPPS